MYCLHWETQARVAENCHTMGQNRQEDYQAILYKENTGDVKCVPEQAHGSLGLITSDFQGKRPLPRN